MGDSPKGRAKTIYSLLTSSNCSLLPFFPLRASSFVLPASVTGHRSLVIRKDTRICQLRHSCFPASCFQLRASNFHLSSSSFLLPSSVTGLPPTYPPASAPVLFHAAHFLALRNQHPERQFFGRWPCRPLLQPIDPVS